MAIFVPVVELIENERRRNTTLNVDAIQFMYRLLREDGETPSTMVRLHAGWLVVAEQPEDIVRLAKAEGRTDGR